MCVYFKEFPIILLKLYNGNQSAFIPISFIKFLDFNSKKIGKKMKKMQKTLNNHIKTCVFGILFNKNY